MIALAHVRIVNYFQGYSGVYFYSILQYEYIAIAFLYTMQIMPDFQYAYIIIVSFIYFESLSN